MASSYAHYRFGQRVLTLLPPETQELIKRYPDYYNLGLHGPDVLFYHHALKENPVSRLGFDLHELSGLSFFQNAASVLRQFRHKEDFEAALSYVYGMLCHFALDSSVHAFVGDYEKKNGIAHVGIETEFDRFLMVIDGKNPIKTHLTDHIHPSSSLASICRRFYPGITQQEMTDAINGMKQIDRLLCAPGILKRGFLYGLMKLLGRYDSLHWHFVGFHPNPLCKESNRRMKALYHQALPLARTLITDFPSFMEEGTIHPNYRFNFEGVEQKL